jgi:hypothetical protein
VGDNGWVTTLRPYDPVRRVQILGDLWKATKNDRTLTVEVRTHPMGWELRALVGLEIHRSEVCKTEPDVFTTSDAWRTEAKAKGWTESGESDVR